MKFSNGNVPQDFSRNAYKWSNMFRNWYFCFSLDIQDVWEIALKKYQFSFFCPKISSFFFPYSTFFFSNGTLNNNSLNTYRHGCHTLGLICYNFHCIIRKYCPLPPLFLAASTVPACNRRSINICWIKLKKTSYFLIDI